MKSDSRDSETHTSSRATSNPTPRKPQRRFHLHIYLFSSLPTKITRPSKAAVTLYVAISNSVGRSLKPYLLQRLKQPQRSPHNSSVSEKFPPRVSIWNHHLNVHGETEIETNSKVLFSFRALVHDSKSPFHLTEIEMENPDEEEVDLNILYGRKYCKRQPKFTSSYGTSHKFVTKDKECTPRWYIFFICQTAEYCLLTRPLLFKDIPHANSCLQPRRIRFPFESPSGPGRVHLTTS